MLITLKCNVKNDDAPLFRNEILLYRYYIWCQYAYTVQHILLTCRLETFTSRTADSHFTFI